MSEMERFRYVCCWAFIAATFFSLGTLAPRSVLAADAEQSIVDGRKALEGRMHYPWYDSAKDELQPITLPTVSRWWRWLPNMRLLGEPLRILAWTLIAVLFFALLYLIVRAIVEHQAGSRQEKSDFEQVLDADHVEALPFMAERPRHDLLGQARWHYEQDNFSEAIIYLFSYELVRLDKSAFIHLTRGKTNRQYLRELARVQPLRKLLERTMIGFEDVFFGSRTLDRQRFEACWNQLDEFETLVSQPRLQQS